MNLKIKSLNKLSEIISNKISLPLSWGSCWSSTSCELRYREEPCDFFDFFLRDRLANGSIRSTNVPDDMLVVRFEALRMLDGLFKSPASRSCLESVSLAEIVAAILYNNKDHPDEPVAAFLNLNYTLFIIHTSSNFIIIQIIIIMSQENVSDRFQVLC